MWEFKDEQALRDIEKDLRYLPPDKRERVERNLALEFHRQYFDRRRTLIDCSEKYKGSNLAVLGSWEDFSHLLSDITKRPAGLILADFKVTFQHVKRLT